MFSSLLVLSLAALAPLANAVPYMTEPVASTSLPAGKQFTITWQDDGKSPNLTAFGPTTIGLFVGSPIVQTQLQLIGNVDVSKVSSLNWTPDPSVGPNYNSYFIRMTSVNLKDANQTSINANAEAFSAKFTLSGMTGTFNSTIQAQISGSTGPSGAASTAAVTTGSGTAGPATSAAAASTVKASTAPSSAASDSSKNNGAGHIVVPRVLGATGVAAMVFAFFL